MKLNIKNKNKLALTINKTQGKARRRIVDTDLIESVAENAEEYLDKLRVPTSKRKGMIARYIPEKLTNSSRGGDGTFFTVTRGGDSWFLTYIERRPCYRTSYGSDDTVRYSVPPAAAPGVLRRACFDMEFISLVNDLIID